MSTRASYIDSEGNLVLPRATFPKLWNPVPGAFLIRPLEEEGATPEG